MPEFLGLPWHLYGITSTRALYRKVLLTCAKSGVLYYFLTKSLE